MAEDVRRVCSREACGLYCHGRSGLSWETQPSVSKTTISRTLHILGEIGHDRRTTKREETAASPRVLTIMFQMRVPEGLRAHIRGKRLNTAVSRIVDAVQGCRAGGLPLG